MRELTYATVCSGVECIGAAVADLPMRPVFFSEIEPFPCAVLKSHYPGVPNLGDMSRIRVTESGKEITNGRTTVALPDGGLDVFAGGTLCQDVSCAGLRRGMAEGSGTRSSLAFEFVRLIGELRPRWIVWKNASSDNPLVVESVGAFENHAQDGRVIPCDGASPTMGASNLNGPSCGNPLVVEGRAVTNSNGGDVMPCISAEEGKLIDTQKDRGDGYVLERASCA